ncbi:MAG: DNA primase [Leptospiraceae bacterium]|nr:DNA primase [Leptospiraceae bacterium]
MQNSSDFVPRVKREVGLEVYISRFVKLKKNGKRLLGLCPFHTEKSPSFTVSPELSVYHCFGCGKSGDLFRFVMDFERVDFNRAKEILSEYSGIPIKESAGANNEFAEKNFLYALNQKFLEQFIRNLNSDDGKLARQYLKSRHILEPEILHFKIGYTLPGFDNWKKMSLSEEEIKGAVKLGLLKVSANNRNHYYDFYRERIMFPIFETGGKVAGFGGRTINPSDEAKYINSPASLIYDKGKMFYNLYNAQNSIRKTKTAILVEGYLDVIGLFSKEFDNAIAPLGTSLTEKQVRTLKNYADKVTILFDGDNAGKKAAFRATEICIKENLPSEVILLENGVDPFDLSNQKTRIEILDLFSKPISSSDFVIQETMQNTTPASKPEQKKKAIENLFQFIKTLEKETDKQSYLAEGAKHLGLSFAAILNDFKKEVVPNFESKKDDNKTKPVAKPNSTSPAIKYERKLISMLILNDSLIHYIHEVLDQEFFDSESSILRDLIYNRFLNNEEISYEAIRDSGIDDSTMTSINPFIFDELDAKDLPEEEKELIFKEALLQQRKFVIDSEISKLSLNQNYLENSQTDLERLMVLRKEKQTILETIGSLSLAKKEVN